MPSLNRVVSIRWSLLRNLLILIAVLSGSLLLTTFLGTREVVRDLAATVIDRTERVTEAEMERFLVPVERSLSVLRDWVESGAAELGDIESFVALFHPFLEQFSQVTSINTGGDDGTGFMLMRLPPGDAGWRTREVRRGEWGRRARFTRRAPDGEPLEEWFEEIDYDPRERPWFLTAGADSSGAVRWTDPYAFFTTREPGMTASVAADFPSGGERRRTVIAFDVRLEDVSALTSELSPSENGIAFVLTERGEAVGLPRNPRFATPEARRDGMLRMASDLGIEALRDGAAALRQLEGLPRGGPLPEGRLNREAVFDFPSGGDVYWAAVRRFPLDIDTALLIGVGIPQSDLLAQEGRQRMALLAATVAAVAIAIVMALLLAKGYSQPLRELVRQSERLRELDTAPRPPPRSRLREVVLLAEAQELTRATLESFARYIPIDVVRQLVRRGSAARIGGEVLPLSILFSDIRNFTTIAESMEPEALTAHVAEYFALMVDVLSANGGTIDKFIGDAVVTFWGAPNPEPLHALRSVRAAILCRERIAERNAEWRARGLPPLHTRFGVATGPALVGNVGSPTRLSYTALGDTANVASRLQDVNRRYGTEILASEAVFDATKAEIEYRRVDAAILKGRHAVMNLYEPLGIAGSVAPDRIELARRYEAELLRYRSRDFAGAETRLAALAVAHPLDGPTAWLRKRCAALRESPPPEDWDGVTRFE